MLKENIELVKGNIKRVANKSGRAYDDITLLGVTKNVEVSKINESTKYGIENIGENRVQELNKKYGSLNDNIKVHMIGHLQRNKVKDIVGKVDLIHSLDRISLAKEIEKRSKKIGVITNTLIQVNTSGEKSKYGISPKDIYELLKEIEKMDYIRVLGLMTIAPHTDNKEVIRNTFKDLRRIMEDIKQDAYKNINMKYLSMGMTNDYEIAIEEGANIIRLGRAIYGERNY